MINNIKELYGEGIYLAEIDGRPAMIPKNPKLGDYHRVREAVAAGAEVKVLPKVIITPDKDRLSADGKDEVMLAVEVRGAEGMNSIDLEVGGLVETVALDGGAGVLGPVAAEAEGDIWVVVAGDNEVECHGQAVCLKASAALKSDKAERVNGRLVFGKAPE